MNLVLPRPDRTYGLIVSVSTYAYGDSGWNRPSLDRGAQQFADWFLGRGVPRCNLLTLPHGDATAITIRDVLVNVVPKWRGDSLWIYWAGHGVLDGDDDCRLLLAGSPSEDKRNLHLKQLLALYRSDFLPGFAQQRIIVEACQEHADALRTTGLSSPIDLPPRARAKRCCFQQVWLAAQRGMPAGYRTDTGGLFTAAVLGSLNEANGLLWEPKHEELQHLLDKARDRSQASDSEAAVFQRLTQWSYRNSDDENYVNGDSPDATRSGIGYLPFEPLDEWSSAFSAEGTLAYIPTRQEYIGGEIQVRAQLVQDVTARLQSGWCLVRGRGTVGKTTLALVFGLQHNSRGGTTYYLKLGEDEWQQQQVREIISAHTGNSTLFILDDVHIDETLAYALFRHWQRCRAGSRLLLVGRSLSRSTRSTIEGTGIAQLEPEAVNVEATDEDLLSTYHRLVRISNRDDVQSAPPPAAVAAWRTLFGGDLIAFAFAIRLHLEGRNPQRWIDAGCPLAGNDAISYVREKYLDPYPSARQWLIKLAAASTAALGMPEEVPTYDALRDLMGTGIVHLTTHGRDAYRLYTLAHPGLGRLILEATRTYDVGLVLSELSATSPFFGFAYAWRLDRVGRRDEATRILQEFSKPQKRPRIAEALDAGLERSLTSASS